MTGNAAAIRAAVAGMGDALHAARKERKEAARDGLAAVVAAACPNGTSEQRAAVAERFVWVPAQTQGGTTAA